MQSPSVVHGSPMRAVAVPGRRQRPVTPSQTRVLVASSTSVPDESRARVDLGAQPSALGGLVCARARDALVERLVAVTAPAPALGLADHAVARTEEAGELADREARAVAVVVVRAVRVGRAAVRREDLQGGATAAGEEHDCAGKHSVHDTPPPHPACHASRAVQRGRLGAWVSARFTVACRSVPRPRARTGRPRRTAPARSPTTSRRGRRIRCEWAPWSCSPELRRPPTSRTHASRRSRTTRPSARAPRR